MVKVRYSSLENWKVRRQDKKTEAHWKRVEEDQGYLNSFQKYQQEWNFREIDYDHQPSNNGLDIGNPAFAFDKKLVKFLETKECKIIDGKIIPGSIRYVD